MPFAAPNLASLYRALGDELTHSAQGSAAETSCRGFFARAGEVLFAGDVMASKPTVRFAPGLWPDVKRNDVIRVAAGRNAGAWRVTQEPQLLLDAEEATVTVERVAS